MKYIYSIYAWLVGGISFFLIFLTIIVLSPFFKPKYLFNYLQFTSKLTFAIIFLRIKIIHEENYDKSQPYIFMPNHVSLLDVILAAAYWPTFMNAIEAKSHFKWFLYGPIIRIFEQVPIDRSNIRESLKSFEIAKERLKNGRSIIVYPEGTRSGTGILADFKKIPFKFAKEAGFKIIPTAFIGIEKVKDNNSVWLKPAKIKIVFGKRITLEQINSMKIEELQEYSRNEVLRLMYQYKD